MSGNDDKHGMLHRAADKATDAMGAVVGRASANTVGSISSAAFVENAAIGDMYEIAAAKLALLQAKSPAVKDAALRMISDHRTSTHQLRSAMLMSETEGVPAPPKELDERRKKMLDHLEKTPADKFDTTYLDQQILAHQETVDLMTGFRDSGDNAQLRSFAAGTAPVVKRHLDHMERLRSDLGKS